jgi:indole-3-glycerol phosphate synthase
MDKLQEIMAWKRREVEPRIRRVSDRELERLATLKRNGLSFAEALARPERLSVIAEIKRRSPSAGVIRELPDASEQARLYYNAGADAISVLTDEKYFGGNIRDLWAVNDLLGGRSDAPPTIRKDFFFHPIQVVEAAEAGAGAILIIVRALNDDEMATLYDVATSIGLDALFEIHNEEELERALEADAAIIGVNNRDLGRFVTDLEYSERLIPMIPDSIIRVSESGIHNGEDAARVRAVGADAVLVGEALMRHKDPEQLMEELRSAQC